MSLKSKLQKLYLYVRKYFNPTFERDGIVYRINNPLDFVEKSLFFDHQHDNRNYMLRKIKPGMIVLDIGSNIGDTFLKISKKIGEQGSIYGFEPCQKTFLFAKKNIELNNIHNGTIFNFGLGDKVETQKLSNNIFNRGSNHITTQGKEIIYIQTLDEWSKEYKIQKIDFIKIDVEGYEYKVLRGGEKTLKKYLPELFFEIDIDFLNRNSTSWTEISDYLENLGYKLINTNTGTVLGREWGSSATHIDVYACKKN